jgi:anti-sigma regulatory factor (Ser/Thr protein kinase)
MHVATERLDLTIKGGHSAPVRARTALRAFNGSLGERRDDVQLLVTELVTNAVVHAGADSDTSIGVRVEAAPDAIRAEVSHPGPRFEARPRPEEQKFGLHLVDRLADRWGSESVEEQNRTWFELDRA